MLRTVLRLFGWAAFVAAARAAWIHHLDNQNVIRTDLARQSFAAGQAAERERRATEERTARVFGATPAPDFLKDVHRERAVEWGGLIWPDAPDWPPGEEPSQEFRERFGQDPYGGPGEEPWTAFYDPKTSEVTFLPPGVDGVIEGDLDLPAGPFRLHDEEAEGHGWQEFDSERRNGPGTST